MLSPWVIAGLLPILCNAQSTITGTGTLPSGVPSAVPSIVASSISEIRASSSASSASAKNSTETSTTSSMRSFTGGYSSGAIETTLSGVTFAAPTGSYVSYASQMTQATSASFESYVSITSNSTTTTATTTTSNSLLLVGSAPTTSSGTGTSTAATPTNTTPCNGYTEFCNRKYSNITEVCAHNSAFNRQNNVFSNQEIDITGQLDDGIRMIQGETHYENGTVYSCHTSCDYLNAGPLVDELTTVASWVRDHPYDVVTILLVNSDFIDVANYTGPIEDSGLSQYVYTPPKVPMYNDDWPTLSQMILSGKRVVVFMDYDANQTKVPYILDEFSQMWETPFSPTDPDFPCTVQRPPGISTMQRENTMYIANHNLNIAVELPGITENIAVPNFMELPQTNSVNGTDGNSTGSLGAMADECTAMWNRPPRWLLVDFYNIGNGSVFDVAAQMNNVTKDPKPCCAPDSTDDTSNGSDSADSAGMAVTASLGILSLVPLFAAGLLL